MDPPDSRDEGASVVETQTDGVLRRSSVRPADRVARYEVLERVGAGAMGTVFLANDPELDRKVAIKVLHADGRRPDVGAKRLLREARAMARLVHPNVVAVHDVGIHDGHVFLAMEFVRGADLRRALQDTPRSWREVAGWMLQAARGLAAAHDAAVVHRDFKPDNVMVDRTGRVCVTDFGLAAGVGETAPGDDVRTAEVPELDDRVGGEQLTRTGALVGTPAYLAPEQFAGLAADPLTDQFAFCVTTWEALFGQRPFGGRTAAELALAVTTGAITPVTDTRGVPLWLRRLLLRGLSSDRTRRLPSMTALADAIDRGLGRRRTLVRWGASVTAIGACAAAAAYVGARGNALECRDGAGVDAVWDRDARAKTRQAVIEAMPTGGEAVYTRLEAEVGGWAKGWDDARDIVCEAETQWPPTVREHAHACLDHQLDELRGLLEAAMQVDRVRAPRLLDAADRLPDSTRCTDRAWLDSAPPPPADPAIAVAVEEHRALLVRLRARLETGEVASVEGATASAVEAARTLGDPPLLAEALQLRGEVLVLAGDSELAESVLEEAYFTATAAQHRRVALQAAASLASAVSTARPHDGEAWMKHARALISSLPTDDRGRAQVDAVDAVLLMALGRLDEARGLLVGVLASHEAAGRTSMVATAEAALGQLEVRSGNLEEAQAHFERARDAGLVVWGEHHPDLANPLVGLATVAMRKGDLELAASTMSDALAIYENTLGPDHPNVIGTLHNLGAIAKGRGRFDEAQSILERVLAMRERTLGREHPDVGATLGLLSSVYEERRMYELARTASERALAIFTEAYGPDHPRVADVLNNIGTLASDTKDYAASVSHLERALAIRRATVGDDHPDTAMILGNLALARMGLGDRAGAREAAVESLEIYRPRFGEDHEQTREAIELLAEIDAAAPPRP